MGLLLHPQTERQLASFVANPPHALLIVGELGAGKGTVARTLAEQLLQISDATQNSKVQWLMDDGKSVPIEQIRELQHFLQLKVPGREHIKRVIIIENASRLSTESQNTLLKTLEEPPADTVIILTVRRPEDVLATISSRTQQLQVKAVSLDAAKLYFEQYPAANLVKNYHLSGGSAGLLTALLENSQDHPLVEQVEVAKKVLQASAFERLSLVESLSKQKDKTAVPNLLWALQRVSDAALQQAGSTENHRLTKRWQASLSHIITAQDELRGNPQTKLLLTDLMLNLT